MWRKGNPSTLLVGMEIGMVNLENSMNIPGKIKNWTTKNYNMIQQSHFCIYIQQMQLKPRKNTTPFHDKKHPTK